MKKFLLLVVFAISTLGIQLTSQANQCDGYRQDKPNNFTGYACSSPEKKECREYQNGKRIGTAPDYKCEPQVNCRRYRNDMANDYTGFACSSPEKKECREYSNGKKVGTAKPWRCEEPEYSAPAVIIVNPSTSPSDPS
ncbi:MAG: hypothetical protein KDD61_09690 [Bdellovibrionales bacterium]|nr:hypothetical protein [Bdellovibrionales bacterium]